MFFAIAPEFNIKTAMKETMRIYQKTLIFMRQNSRKKQMEAISERNFAAACILMFFKTSIVSDNDFSVLKLELGI